MRKNGVERLRVHGRDGRGVQRADPAPQLERPGEGLLDRDLLVEREPDEEREGVLRQEAIRVRDAGERKVIRGDGRACGASYAPPTAEAISGD